MKPNILLINCDDLGYGDLGCYGSTKNDTPNLDQLAAEGRRFTDFYMASPVCSPSRGGMMTGCYPPRIGFGSFHGEWVLFPGYDIGLNPSEYAMPRLFKSVGYSTMHIGKWHCGDQPGFLPTDHGFDDYYGLPYSNDMAPMPSRPTLSPLPLMHGSEPIELNPDQCAITERYVEKGVEFIRANKNTPFFLYFAHMHVHRPLYAAKCFVEKSRNGDYGACVASIDWSVGALIAELKHSGVYENTIIIFTSDNGSRNDCGDSNGQLRGTKATCWEGGLRVPFIVYWKDHVLPGVTSDIMTSMDLYPTFAKIIGAEIPKDRIIDGIEMADYMLGKVEHSPRDTFFYYMCNNLEAVRCGDWKLHVSRRGNCGKPSASHDGTEAAKAKLVEDKNHEVCELYNLRDDVSELNNVYDEHPDIVAELMKKIEACRNDLGDEYTGTKGKNVRPIGRVPDAKPIAEYDSNHPYIIAMYDRDEIG